MTKSELIARLLTNHRHLNRRDIGTIVDTIFGKIATALSQDGRAELRGFGTFSVKRRNSHIGRNPTTGAKIQVGPKYLPHFKTGRLLKRRLNTG